MDEEEEEEEEPEAGAGIATLREAVVALLAILASALESVAAAPLLFSSLPLEA